MYERYDPSLVSLIPSGIDVIRVQNRDPWQAFQARRRQHVQLIDRSSAEQAVRIHSAHQRRVRALLRHAVHAIEAYVYRPDISMGWIDAAAKVVVDLSKRKAPNVLWATAGPVSAFIVASRASKQTGVP